MIKLRRIVFALLSLGLVALLTGCKLAVLDPKGTVAIHEKHLLIDAVSLMLIIVIPVILLALWIAWKYRASNTKAHYSPHWGHSTILELGWWLIPCVIIFILAVITWRSTHLLDPYRPLHVVVNDVEVEPITIQVVSLDWKWLFIYPDQKIATVNFVEIPINTPIRFLITSDAPMNSLEIPQLAGQIYSMPGMRTKLFIDAKETGDYNGFSANFSGDGFSGMKFVVRATSTEDFSKWVQSVQQSPEKLTMDVYNQLALPSENNKVEYFSLAEPDLFNNVMMKYMMPMPNANMAPSNN